jgi:hypothetical protein
MTTQLTNNSSNNLPQEDHLQEDILPQEDQRHKNHYLHNQHYVDVQTTEYQDNLNNNSSLKNPLKVRNERTLKLLIFGKQKQI